MNDRIAAFDRFLDRLDRSLGEEKRWLLFLFILALALKTIYALQSADALSVRVPVMDAKYYDQTAIDIAAGKVLRPDAYFMGPLYPYVLAIIYSILGHDFTIVRLVQMLGGACTVVLTFLIGKHVMRPAAAFLGALILCFYGTITFYEGQLLMMWLGTVLNACAILLLLRAGQRDGIALFVASGAVLGLSALARANVLAFVPVVVVWIVVVIRQRWLAKSAAFVVTVMVMLLPATIHNYVTSRDFVLVTSNAGLNFYIGNSKIATGYFYPPTEMDFVVDGTTRTLVERRLGRNLSPSEVSNYWFREAFKEIRENPQREIKILLRKFGMFFNAFEVPQIENYDAERQKYSMLRVLFVNFWALGALGLFGILLCLRDWRRYFLISGFVFAYALTIVLFFVTARYRVQVAPILSLFAAHTILVAPRYTVSFRRAAAFAGGIVLLLLLMHPSLFAWRPDELEYRQRIHDGRRLSTIGDHDGALREIDAAIALIPDAAEGYLHRAIVYNEANDQFRAIENYQRALDRDPNLPSVRYDLAQALRRINYLERAAQEYMRAIELDPYMIQAYNNLGITLREMGNYDEAAASFRKVIDLDPNYEKGYGNLGACLAEAGKTEDAIHVFQDALSRFPDYALLYKNLAMAHISLQQVGPAIDALQKYSAIVPEDESARGVLEKLYIAAQAADSTDTPPTD